MLTYDRTKRAERERESEARQLLDGVKDVVLLLRLQAHGQNSLFRRAAEHGQEEKLVRVWFGSAQTLLNPLFCPSKPQ